MRRKGVSPVIATLLLIVIAVVAAVLAYIWVSGYMGRVTSQAETEAPQLQERIKIDAVSVESNQVTIYVSNIGDTQVTIANAFVLTEDKVAICGGQGISVTPQTIEAHQSGQVTFSCSIQTSGTYIAKVVTGRGVEATYTFTYTPLGP